MTDDTTSPSAQVPNPFTTPGSGGRRGAPAHRRVCISSPHIQPRLNPSRPVRSTRSPSSSNNPPLSACRPVNLPPPLVLYRNLPARPTATTTHAHTHTPASPARHNHGSSVVGPALQITLPCLGRTAGPIPSPWLASATPCVHLRGLFNKGNKVGDGVWSATAPCARLRWVEGTG